MDSGGIPVLENNTKVANQTNTEDDQKSESPKAKTPLEKEDKQNPTSFSTPPDPTPQIKPSPPLDSLNSTQKSPTSPTTTNGKRKIDEVTNKTDEPVAKRVLTAPVLQTVVLKDGRTVIVKNGKIVATIKTNPAPKAPPPSEPPKTTLAVPLQPASGGFPTSQPPPVQPNTDAPPATGYPPMPMGYPARYPPSYYAPQAYPQPMPRFNVVPPPEKPAQHPRKSPEKESKRESRWGEIKKYDLKAVIDAASKFMERRTPGDPMQRWKFQGVNGYQLRKNMQKNFPYIKLSDFGVERWEEFVLKHVPNSEMVGLNVRLKPSIPDQLKRPMEVVVKYLRKHEPVRVENQVFWKGVGLSVLLGHVQKECPNFKFQKWYKKWKKFVAEIPECQFFQEGNSLSVRLYVENRNEIFQRESIRREVSRLRVSRTKSAAKSLKKITEDVTQRGLEKESVTLYDILGQCPVEYPARGPRCEHIQPFELSHYLKTNMFPTQDSTENPRWRCQICGEICRKEEVYVDGFWAKVIDHNEFKEAKPNVVFIFADGKVGFKRDSEIPKFEILNAEEMEAGLQLEWEEIVLPPSDRFTPGEYAGKVPEQDSSPNQDEESKSSPKSPTKIDKDSVDRSEIETFPPVPMRSIDKKRVAGNGERKRSIPREKKRRSQTPDLRGSNSYEPRRRSKEYKPYRWRRRDQSEEKSRRRKRRSRSRHRDRRKKKPRITSPVDDEDAVVSTSLVDLYEEMVKDTLSTKRGEITMTEAKDLAKLRSQCCVEEAQHLEVLRRLGLSMPTP